MNSMHCNVLTVEYHLEETIFTDPADECIWGNASQYSDLGQGQ